MNILFFRYFLLSSLIISSAGISAQPIQPQQTKSSFVKDLEHQYRAFRKELIHYRDCITGKRKCTDAERATIKKGLAVGAVALVGALTFVAYRYWPKKQEVAPTEGTVATEHKKLQKMIGKKASEQPKIEKMIAELRRITVMIRGIKDLENYPSLYYFIGDNAATAQPKELKNLIDKKMLSIKPDEDHGITMSSIDELWNLLKNFFNVGDDFDPADSSSISAAQRAKKRYDDYLKRMPAQTYQPGVGVAHLLD